MTIWLLAYPVGEYVPSRRGPQPTAAARIAEGVVKLRRAHALYRHE